MPMIEYVPKRFQAASLAMIDRINNIIAEYRDQGYSLTLRQLYYQFVARDIIPNKLMEYKKLGALLSNARMAGLVDWNAIEDRTRFVRELAHWDSPADIVGACARQFRVDRWSAQYQPCRVEVWIEKDALVGVFERVCESLDVPLFSCRGYGSQSELWRAARRFQEYVDDDQAPVILHFGDHDPSGLDMTRDIQTRMTTFGVNMEVRRLALNMDQVEQYTPPPNPARTTDARFQTYAAQYGNESWELDALEPTVLSSLVRKEIERFRDQEGWSRAADDIEDGREAIRKLAEQLN